MKRRFRIYLAPINLRSSPGGSNSLNSGLSQTKIFAAIAHDESVAIIVTRLFFPLFEKSCVHSIREQHDREKRPPRRNDSRIPNSRTILAIPSKLMNMMVILSFPGSFACDIVSFPDPVRSMYQQAVGETRLNVPE